MISVAFYHISQILFTPFFKEIKSSLKSGSANIPAFQPFAFREFPFIKCFIQNQQSQLVAQLVKVGRLRIMAGANRIHPDFLQSQ